MNEFLEHGLNQNRRKFLSKLSLGIGGLALGSLVAPGLFEGKTEDELFASVLPHFAPKAKRVIYLFQNGAPSQLDLEITYNNVTKDSSSRRSITPISIIAEDKRTLVSAYCHSAKALRTFNLAQISEVSTKARIVRADLERLEDSRGSSAEVIIKSEDSSFLSENASSLKELSKSCYQIDIFQPEWIVRSVLAGADSIELAKPHELRAEIAERANRALLAYKG